MIARRGVALLVLALLGIGLKASAQSRTDPLTDEEINQLRDTAVEPDQRMKLYVDFSRARLVALEQMRANPKTTDRGFQTHKMLEDFLSVYEELDNNLDNFQSRRDDLRKVLQVIIAGDTEFQAKLRALKDSAATKPAELKEYEILLSDAIETVDTSADDHRKLLAEQVEFFKKKEEASEIIALGNWLGIALRTCRALFFTAKLEAAVHPNIQEIFRESYRELRAADTPPEMRIEFFAFANLNNTIRLRQGRLLVRLSDLLEGAPEPVLRALAHILLAKMYRRPIERTHASRYRRYVHSHEIRDKAHLVRQMRGRKHIASAKGRVYHLDAVFEDLNVRFFDGLLARPRMTWSQRVSRNRLGHYDPAHNAIVISRLFDHPGVPRYAVEYIVYHEMLHLKHPVQLRGSRRCVHSREFLLEERQFPQLEAARRFLRRV